MWCFKDYHLRGRHAHWMSQICVFINQSSTRQVITNVLKKEQLFLILTRAPKGPGQGIPSVRLAVCPLGCHFGGRDTEKRPVEHGRACAWPWGGAHCPGLASGFTCKCPECSSPVVPVVPTGAQRPAFTIQPQKCCQLGCEQQSCTLSRGPKSSEKTGQHFHIRRDSYEDFQSYAQTISQQMTLMHLCGPGSQT